MVERAAEILAWLVGLPDWLVYILAGVAAALENLIPPLPADVVIVIGGVIAGAGGANTFALFLVVWLGNVGSALLVYELGRHFGPRFFEGRLGQILLAPPQLYRLARAYERYGFPIIFVSRFLPVFRPVVPAFAGVVRLGFLGTAFPIALASAIWYGALVYFGSAAGQNWRGLFATLERVGGWMWGIAAVLIALILVVWKRTRGEPMHGEGET